MGRAIPRSDIVRVWRIPECAHNERFFCRERVFLTFSRVCFTSRARSFAAIVKSVHVELDLFLPCNRVAVATRM